MWDASYHGCLLLDLLHTQVSRACMQILLPNILGLTCVFLAAGPQRGKLLISATPVSSVSSISHCQIDIGVGCRVGNAGMGVFKSSWGETIPKKGVPAAARLSHCLHYPTVGRGDSSWPTALPSYHAAKNHLGKRFLRCKGDGLSSHSTLMTLLCLKSPGLSPGCWGSPYPPMSQHMGDIC